MMTDFLIKTFVRTDDTASPESRKKYANLSGIVGIVCNILLFALKLLAGVLSSSISIIADAFNNFSDMGSSIITMLGFKLSSKPADKEHPYGHGRMEYMAGFIVSSIIVVVGIELLISAVQKFFSPEKMDVSYLTVAILIASILVKFWLYVFNKKVGRMLSSSTVLATAKDSLNDSVATFAVLVTTLLFKFFGINIDAVAGVIVAGFIIYGGIMSALDTINPLLGEPPSAEFVDELCNRVLRYDMFCGVHDVIIHNYGPGRIFASIHIEVPSDVDINKCHEQIDLCEKEVGDELGIMLVAHMDPIDTGESVSAYRNIVSKVLCEIDPELSMHDFRMVKGENNSNLIFDVVVPFKFKLTTQELAEVIKFNVSKCDPTCNCVMIFDTKYN